MNSITISAPRFVVPLLATVALMWAAAVVAGARSGWFSAMAGPRIALIVAATIVAPALWYLAWSPLRRFVEGLGHRPLMAMHVWRIPAALLFFWYGLQGALPPLFWVLAGTGDAIAGGYAAYLLMRPPSRARYASFHAFGFADFIVAVSTGLTYTLLGDARMAPITTLPLAFIPLFGVGISGATHLIAFDLLRRGRG